MIAMVSVFSHQKCNMTDKLAKLECLKNEGRTFSLNSRTSSTQKDCPSSDQATRCPSQGEETMLKSFDTKAPCTLLSTSGGGGGTPVIPEALRSPWRPNATPRRAPAVAEDERLASSSGGFGR